jgi:hypothetical protein
MGKQIKIFLAWGLVFSGLMSFVLQINRITPLLLAAILYCLLILALHIFPDRFDWIAALPFASGLLCFFCRLFYWDRLDWTRRVENLLLLSFIFSLLILIYRLKLARGFLLFSPSSFLSSLPTSSFRKTWAWWEMKPIIWLSPNQLPVMVT